MNAQSGAPSPSASPAARLFARHPPESSRAVAVHAILPASSKKHGRFVALGGDLHGAPCRPARRHPRVICPSGPQRGQRVSLGVIHSDGTARFRRENPRRVSLAGRNNRLVPDVAQPDTPQLLAVGRPRLQSAHAIHADDHFVGSVAVVVAPVGAVDAKLRANLPQRLAGGIDHGDSAAPVAIAEQARPAGCIAAALDQFSSADAWGSSRSDTPALCRSRRRPAGAAISDRTGSLSPCLSLPAALHWCWIPDRFGPR